MALLASRRAPCSLIGVMLPNATISSVPVQNFELSKSCPSHQLNLEDLCFDSLVTGGSIGPVVLVLLLDSTTVTDFPGFAAPSFRLAAYSAGKDMAEIRLVCGCHVKLGPG